MVEYLKNSEEKDQAYFNYQVTNITETNIDIKLNFSDPILISQGS